MQTTIELYCRGYVMVKGSPCKHDILGSIPDRLKPKTTFINTSPCLASLIRAQYTKIGPTFLSPFKHCSS